jgi:hypothetical protein
VPQSQDEGGGTRGSLCAPPDQATEHTRGRGREAQLARGGFGPGRCGLWLGLSGLRGRGLRLQPRRGLGAARGLGKCASLESRGAHITRAATGRRRRALLGCRVSRLLLLLQGPAA